jgi:hypothetical protein
LKWFSPQSQKKFTKERRFKKIPFIFFQKIDTIWRKEQFNPTDPKAMATTCKHPRVRIVSRHEDTEYVECLECGDVFDSEEFRDMEIEESAESEDALNDY